jgi:hypothetical protein
MKKYKRYHKDDEWSQEELKKLRELYPRLDKTIGEIASEFPGRTRNAVLLKANRLGLIRPILIRDGFCPYCGQPIKEAKI